MKSGFAQDEVKEIRINGDGINRRIFMILVLSIGSVFSFVQGIAGSIAVPFLILVWSVLVVQCRVVLLPSIIII